jgi:hypothetical protein
LTPWWGELEYIHCNSVTRRRQRKGNQAPGCKTAPLCHGRHKYRNLVVQVGSLTQDWKHCSALAMILHIFQSLFVGHKKKSASEYMPAQMRTCPSISGLFVPAEYPFCYLFPIDKHPIQLEIHDGALFRYWLIWCIFRYWLIIKMCE